jgi:hypothetical protein
MISRYCKKPQRATSTFLDFLGLSQATALNACPHKGLGKFRGTATIAVIALDMTRLAESIP